MFSIPFNRLAVPLAIVLSVLAAPVAAQPLFVPAAFLGGQLPVAPGMAGAGGQVFLEALVADDGQVMAVRPLRTTPGFTDQAIKAVNGWRFRPATEDVPPLPGKLSETKPVQNTVFVAAVFTAPAVMGPTAGQKAVDVARASDESPSPTSVGFANYPVQAFGAGTVLVEVTIDPQGSVADSRIKVSSPGFDAVALSSARAWAFRAARRQGVAVFGRAYLIYSFQAPVLAPPGPGLPPNPTPSVVTSPGH